MDRTAFIFHGTGNDSKGNWFPWVRNELEKRGFEVHVPDFPTPEGQSLESWLEVFGEYEERVDEESVFIGHSTGAVFILDLLDLKDFDIRAAFLVSGFVDSLGSERFDPLNETFAERDFDWRRLRERCGDFYLFHSIDDPYVPVEKAEELNSKLDAKLFLHEESGHFNTEAGYESFAELVTLIEKELV